jgi:glycosyltransferase involved in cell wall biosynthesis
MNDRGADMGVEISLLLPTRGRAALVQRLFDSLVQTTADLRHLEVVLCIDEDDSESREICRRELSLIKIVGAPGRTMGKMNRDCYESSHGRYVMLVNDDLIFRTPHWDRRVLETASRFADEIAIIYGNDLDQGAAVPTFPIVSRRVCELLGEICPSGYRHLHIESHLLDIFKQLARLGHKRICYLDDVIFEHMHYVVGKSALDTTYAKKNQRLDDLLFIALDEERAFAAKILARCIEASDSEHSTEAKTEHPAVPAGQVDPKLGFVARIKRMLFST